MYKDDYDYVTESIGEQLLLMLWTSVATLTAVGIILAIALQCLIIRQKGTSMATLLWKAELTDELIAHLSDDDKVQIRRDLDKAIEAICEEYQVGKEYSHE